MRRREFIAGLGAAIALPVAVKAQQSAGVMRIGVLMGIADDAVGQSRTASLREGMQTLGWKEGVNTEYHVRWAEGDVDRAKRFAAELVALRPLVIVANSAPATLALKEATKSIPIVFVQVNDPVGQGLVESLANPGGNVTGFLNFEPAIAGKWLELLKEIAPRLTRVGVLYSQASASRGGGGRVHLSVLQEASPRLGIELMPIALTDASDIAPAIGRFTTDFSGLIVLPDVFNTVNRAVIIEAAAAHRIPTIYPYRYFVADGGFVSYGVEINDLYRRAASYVDRLLRGEKPDRLPVQAPTKLQLVLNAKTLKALGLDLPPMLFSRADEVIE
ncbi:ABC transporter substrate-binding protein [Bradyrhizobium lablabi]|uniref:ABC transporter substrate-binding protein n=1 Tax=Bradyrhizobium lablabi TaxID=722472 RepID=UPI001BA9EA82|nr:ABC transporter substrate-binding protein [Bradyrhizobium lablabi]MBR1124569.1 ABC transporter substrate-binding protein [Bradyrhizobium lablabi]